jgi:hypothetical protein
MWILTTRRPGQTLQPNQLESHQADGISKQLARYMSQWRDIPARTQHRGNLRFVGPGREHLTSWDGKFTLFDKGIAVHGLIIDSAASAVRPPEEYYTTKLRNELAILKDNEKYPFNRATIVPLSKTFSTTSFRTPPSFIAAGDHSLPSIFTH